MDSGSSSKQQLLLGGAPREKKGKYFGIGASILMEKVKF